MGQIINALVFSIAGPFESFNYLIMKRMQKGDFLKNIKWVGGCQKLKSRLEILCIVFQSP